MNIDKLKTLEKEFLMRYPLGFEEEEMKVHSKKHQLQKNHENILKVCGKENLSKGISVFNDVVNVVMKSSLVSVFEKVKFKDIVHGFSNEEKMIYINAVYQLIHGDERLGFETLVQVLDVYKIAKWPIITIYLAYYNMDRDIFIKPTTVKKIIAYLEIEDLKYGSKVNYDFYVKYRDMFNGLKMYLDKRLYPNNPAFSGFFMVLIG